MTLPYQEKYALLEAEKFLTSLIDPKKTPRIPKKYRLEAHRVLRHYPYKGTIEKLYKDIDKKSLNL